MHISADLVPLCESLLLPTINSPGNRYDDSRRAQQVVAFQSTTTHIASPIEITLQAFTAGEDSTASFSYSSVVHSAQARCA